MKDRDDAIRALVVGFCALCKAVDRRGDPGLAAEVAADMRSTEFADPEQNAMIESFASAIAGRADSAPPVGFTVIEGGKAG